MEVIFCTYGCRWKLISNYPRKCSHSTCCDMTRLNDILCVLVFWRSRDLLDFYKSESVHDIEDPTIVRAFTTHTKRIWGGVSLLPVILTMIKSLVFLRAELPHWLLSFPGAYVYVHPLKAYSYALGILLLLEQCRRGLSFPSFLALIDFLRCRNSNFSLQQSRTHKKFSTGHHAEMNVSSYSRYWYAPDILVPPYPRHASAMTIYHIRNANTVIFWI